MAISPNTITAALLANRASGGFPMAGSNFDRLALGVGMAVGAWGISQPQNLALTGATTGSAGAGAINPATTKLVVPPTVPIMSGALAGAGMVGPLAQSLAVVVTLSISQSFSASAQYLGTSAGVGLGADVSKVSVANAATLIGLLMANLTATLGPGSALTIMATGLGNGIAALLLTGTGTGAVSGPPSPSPGAGTSLSVVI